MRIARYSVLLAVCAFRVAASILSHPALNRVTPLPSPCHAPVRLVAEGRPQCVLVWDSASEANACTGLVQRPIHQSVRTLRRELIICTGGEDVEVVDLAKEGGLAAAQDGRAQILVGRSALTDALGIDPTELPPEGFVVTSFSNGVAIVGNDSSIDPTFPRADPLYQKGPRRSTLWGVYDFLERFLGCRYYFPGVDGSVRPVCTNLVVKPFAYRDAPRFRNRADYATHIPLAVARRTLGVPLLAAQLADWRAALRVARTEPFAAIHSPNPIDWAKAHPELIETSFFRTPDGRLLQSHHSHYSNYFNVVNLKFADALVDACRRFYATGGQDRQGFNFNNGYYISFGQCDAFCHLDTLRNDETVRREGLITDANLALGPYGYFSDVYARFYLHLATRLRTALPDKKLILLPYAGCTYAPTQERFRHLPDNVELGVCLPKVPRFIRNDAVRRLYTDQMRQWSETIGGRPVQQIWTYNACNGIFDHAVANEFLPEVVSAFGATLGEVELINELDIFPTPVPDHAVSLYFYYETYCALRTMWNGAHFDPDAALDEHWTLFYGPAAGSHLRRMHHLIKDAFLAVSVPAAKVQMLYPPSTLDAIERELLAAERILAINRASPEWRRYKLISQPLKFEIEDQRARHAAPDADRREVLLFIAGEDHVPSRTSKLR